MKFRLVKGAGAHKQAGQVYRAGDIVENKADLSKLFPGKFEVVEGADKDDPDAPEAELSETHTPFDTQQTRRRPAAPKFAPRGGTAEDAVAEVDAETEAAIAAGEAEGPSERVRGEAPDSEEQDEEDGGDEEEGVTRGARAQTRRSQPKAASKAAKAANKRGR